MVCTEVFAVVILDKQLETDLEITLEKSGEDPKTHSKRVEKISPDTAQTFPIQFHTRFECSFFDRSQNRRTQGRYKTISGRS